MYRYFYSLFALLFACSTGEKPAQIDAPKDVINSFTYSDSTGAFELEIPFDWKIERKKSEIYKTTWYTHLFSPDRMYHVEIFSMPNALKASNELTREMQRKFEEEKRKLDSSRKALRRKLDSIKSKHGIKPDTFTSVKSSYNEKELRQIMLREGSKLFFEPWHSLLLELGEVEGDSAYYTSFKSYDAMRMDVTCIFEKDDIRRRGYIIYLHTELHTLCVRILGQENRFNELERVVTTLEI